jgi:hypothetical protein
VSTRPQDLQTRIAEATRILEPFCVQLRPGKGISRTVINAGRPRECTSTVLLWGTTTLACRTVIVRVSSFALPTKGAAHGDHNPPPP